MKLRKFYASGVVSAALLFAALPARAGIPTIDFANLASAIMQLLSWVEQAEQMIDQYNKMQDQYQQMQAMTQRLEGARNLGTILNDPAVKSAMPSEFRNASQLITNPQQLVSSPGAVRQTLSSFGVRDSTTPNPVTEAMADGIGRSQQILDSAQKRGVQLQQLASRTDSTADAKDSTDMVSRNVLEVANVTNTLVQTTAAMEAARQGEELKRVAANQTYFSNLKAGGAQPLKTYSY